MATETRGRWTDGGGVSPGDGVRCIVTLEAGENPWHYPSGRGELVTELEPGETLTLAEAQRAVEEGDREPVDYIYWHRGDELWIAPVEDA